jgi:hypothetical protein
MKQIVLIISFIILISCQENEPFTFLTGKINGTDAKEIELEGINFSKKIPLQANGTFSDTLDLPYDGMYYLILTDEKIILCVLRKRFSTSIGNQS